MRDRAIKDKITELNAKSVERYFEVEREILKLHLVSGYTVKELSNLFLKGYKLQPPEPSLSLSEIDKIMKERDIK